MGYKMSNLNNNSLYERVNKLLVSYEWSDCSFSVQGTTFRAHKLILGISSPVFEAMFYGPLSTDEDITVTDIEPNIFQLLLKYIYTDQVDIKSIEESYELLYVSRKYLLEYLTEICIAYIKSNLSIDNVVSILNYPDYMQDSEIVSTALKLFCQHADYLLKENNSHITPSCMQKFLSSNEMNIVEKNLIKSVFKWTSSYCEANEVKNNFQNRRDILAKNGLLKLLRFYSLSENEIEEIANCKDNLLLSYEEESIKQAARNPENIKVLGNFNNKLMPRKPLKLQWCLCHRPPIRSESPINIDYMKRIIHTNVKANKSTFINSLSIQTRMSPVLNCYINQSKVYYEQFTISITCESDKKIVKIIEFNNHVEYDSNIYIEFDEPLLIKKDTWYKFSFEWPPRNIYYSHQYGIQSRDCYYNNGKIKFEFKDFSDNGGSFLRGLKFCT